MGMDVDLYVEGDVTDDELKAGREQFTARLGSVGATIDRDYEGHVRISSMDRYWGPGYERGDWPRIYAWIRGLRAAFPGHEVRYGGDADFDQAITMTAEELEEYWAHWESPQWDNYYSRRALTPVPSLTLVGA